MCYEGAMQASRFEGDGATPEKGRAGSVWLTQAGVGGARAVTARLDAADQLKEGLRRLTHDEIGLADWFRLLHDMALTSGEETFTLSERPLKVGAADFVLSSAAGSAKVGEAMRAIARAYNFLHGGDFNRVEARGETISYLIDDETFPYTVPRDEFLHFSLECTLIVLHGALCQIAACDITHDLRRVSTRRGRRQPKASQALTFWGLPVRYGARRYALTYDAAVADRPLALNRSHDHPQAALHKAVLGLIESRAAPAGCRESEGDRVARLLREGATSQEDIAAGLGLSVATLRRRLGAEGHSFRAVRERVLCESAKLKLGQAASVSSVADALGFSDSRSFSRAFSAWTGVTPAAWIHRRAAEGQTLA